MSPFPLFFYFDIAHAIFAITLLVYHQYRVCIKSKENENASANEQGRPAHSMQNIALMILILNFLRPLSYLIIESTNHYICPWINDSTCRYVYWLIPSMIYTFNKFFIHLFITLRTRLSRSKAQKWSLSLKIAFCLMISDILLILFTPVNILAFGKMRYIENICTWTSDISWDSIAFVNTWTVISDFIISLYCLFVFILPLRKLVSFEKDQKAQNSNIQKMVLRVMIYSSIMLLTTMVLYGVFLAHFSVGCMTMFFICTFTYIYTVFSVWSSIGYNSKRILRGYAILTN